MKHTLYLWTLMSVVTLFCACTDDRDDNEENEHSAMCLELEAPRSAESRNNYSVTAPETVGEKLTDGWAIEDIALFICKENGSVEAYRQMSLDCSGSYAAAEKVKFTLSETNMNAAEWVMLDPYNEVFNITGKHSLNVTPQGQGQYEVYAVANYKDNAAIKKIIDDANTAADGGAGTALNEQLALLKKAQINVDDGLYNSSEDMVLSIHDKIQVTPGVNTFHSALRRSCARIRITVRNECVKYKMTIKDIKLGNISRSAIPLFAPDDIEAQAPDTEPLLSSARAKIPFGEVTVNENVKKNGTDTYDNQAVVFDGYIMENSEDKGYNFKITARAETGGISESTTEYIISKKGSYMNKGNDKYYLITSWDGENGLCYQGTGPLTMKKVSDKVAVSFEGTDEAVVNDYLWIYDGTNIYSKSNPDVHIVTNENGKNADGVQAQLGAQKNECPLLTEMGHIYWEGNIGSDYYGLMNTYFYIDAALKWQQTGMYLDYGDQSYYPEGLPYSPSFYFVPVQIKTTQSGPPVSTQQFPFTKMVNKKPREVKEIHRNDFYHVFINVRYNEKSGTFDFDVSRWNDGGGNIEFY